MSSPLIPPPPPSGQRSTSAPHRIGSLDGIRAVAILLVFSSHTILPWHGWEGVHLFFVLSGFLITGILRRARHDQSFWPPFYIKRATRILPPLVLCLILGYLLYSPPIGILSLYALFAANIVEVTHHNIGGGLGVLWSLSVEEHFYLLWPFAIRFLRRRQLLILCAVLLVCEPIVRALAHLHFPERNLIYMLTPFQLDGLLAGSMLSLLCEDQSVRATIARLSRPLAAFLVALYIGLNVFCRPFTFRSNSLLFNSVGYSLVAFAAAALVASVYLHPRSIVSRLLGSWPMVFLGTISYGFYLFHLLLLDLCRRVLQHIYGHPRELRAIPLAFVLTVALSWLSFHTYERPLILWGRRRAQRFNARKSPPVPAI
ncbi:MAG TPA: acyltransferase [Acidobacteriaceae bacterium]|jgi:peptidoglycan/LPS O-acetylase OafA/YrhL|nr:acyltransferase [Acidobacteriaceae bacterium]